MKIAGLVPLPRSAAAWFASRIALLWLAAPAGLPTDAFAADRIFETLTVGSQTLTNAVVFGRTESLVMFSHRGGLISFPTAELEPAVRRALGFDSPALESLDAASLAGGPLERLRAWIKSALEPGSTRWYSLAGAALFICLVAGLYLYTSYLFWVICVRTGTEPGISVWLPFFQILPLLRAARLSPAWALLWLIISAGAAYARFQSNQLALLCDAAAGLACATLWIAWSVRISMARGKSPWLALILLIPGFNYVALLYLAASD
ncbi:MAG: hypothetical protein KJ072_08450 [Verrucomicrobia bacterium]|nr:hypothetical protein [Verrucomicrobiota bacterium]